MSQPHLFSSMNPLEQSDFEFVPPGQTGERKGVTATATLPRTTFPAPPPQARTENPPFDICQRKHGGNPNSTAANQRISALKPTLREQTYQLIAESGSSGRTLHEICQILGKYPNSISGRLTELRIAGRIRTEKNRNDAAVWVKA